MRTWYKFIGGVQEDLFGAELKPKGILEVCEVVLIISVSISQLVSLNPVLRGIKKTDFHEDKKNFKCSVVKKFCKVNICSLPLWKVTMFISIVKVLLSLAIQQAVYSVPNLFIQRKEHHCVFAAEWDPRTANSVETLVYTFTLIMGFRTKNTWF